MSRAPQPKIQHFILVYDRKLGQEVEQIHFGTDAKAAVTAYERLEARYRDVSSMDIVLVGSDSLDTIKVTHSTYFDDVESAFDQLLNLTH